MGRKVLDQQESKKQTICLCMIVKNEEEVITQAFDSVSNIVDYIVVCDTGSTDDTIEIMEDWFKDNNIKGEVHQRPWVDFSHNRTEAFNYAKGKCDYIMTLDADEVIAPYKDGKAMLGHKLLTIPELTTDRVEIRTVYGPVVYNRTQFFKDGLDWSWRWPIHEICSAPEAETTSLLVDLCDVPSPTGNRRKDPNTFKRDALVFENWVLDNPTDTRGWFYVAQSYRDAGEVNKAIGALDKVADLSEWPEEKWLVTMRKSRYRREGGQDFMSVARYLWEAFDLRPHRAEPLYDLLVYFRENNQWWSALLVGELIYNLPFPEQELLFVEHEIYNWRIKDELSIVYYHIMRHEEAAQMMTELIQDKDKWDYPPKTLKRIRKNLRYCKKRIKEVEESK